MCIPCQWRQNCTSERLLNTEKTAESGICTAAPQEQESLRKGTLSQRLIERSVFSDRMVFVRAVHNAKWMSELELNVYDSWFNPIVSALPTVTDDMNTIGTRS